MDIKEAIKRISIPDMKALLEKYEQAGSDISRIRIMADKQELPLCQKCDGSGIYTDLENQWTCGDCMGCGIDLKDIKTNWVKALPEVKP